METQTYTTRAALMRVKAWRTIVERIEDAPRADGTRSHYFDRATIRYWANIWHGKPIPAPYSQDFYYVESARPDDDDPRYYQIKVCRANGIVDTISEWPHYPTADAALAAARFLAGVTK